MGLCFKNLYNALDQWLVVYISSAGCTFRGTSLTAPETSLFPEGKARCSALCVYKGAIRREKKEEEERERNI